MVQALKEVTVRGDEGMRRIEEPVKSFNSSDSDQSSAWQNIHFEGNDSTHDA